MVEEISRILKTAECMACKSPDRICNTWTIRESHIPKDESASFLSMRIWDSKARALESAECYKRIETAIAISDVALHRELP